MFKLVAETGLSTALLRRLKSSYPNPTGCGCSWIACLTLNRMIVVSHLH